MAIKPSQSHGGYCGPVADARAWLAHAIVECANCLPTERDRKVEYLNQADSALIAYEKLIQPPTWQPIETVPDTVTRAILLWPALRLDDDGNLTDEPAEGQSPLVAVGYRSGKAMWEGGPEIEGVGEYFGDQWEYGDPTHWMPLPDPLKVPA